MKTLGIFIVLPTLVGLVAGGGGPEGASMTVPEWNQYCMYSIHTVLGTYTWYDPTSASTNSSSSSNSSGSSGSDDSGSSGGSSSKGSGGSSSSHGHRLMARGRGGSTTTTQCDSEAQVRSIFAAAKKHCRPKELKAGISWWRTQCTSTALIDLDSIEAEMTASFISSLPPIDPETNTTASLGTLNTTALLTESYYLRAYKSYWGHDYALFWQDRVYGWALMAFWGGAIVFGMITNLCSKLFVQRYLGSDDVEAKFAKKPSAYLSAIHPFRTHLTIPPTFNILPYHQKLWFWNTIPKRFDSILVFGFWILSIILSCCGYLSFNGNISTTSVPQQVWQYMSDRTGILSYACFPMLWLFGLRNNIFIWATGWSFRSFNIFHRHIARIATIEAILHSIGYTVLYTRYETMWSRSIDQQYFYLGILATIIMSLMLVFSHDWLRAKFYETFLILHIAMAIIVLYSLFCHTPYETNLYNNPYLWPPVAFWCADRFLRVARAIYCNLHVGFSGKLIKTTSATVSYSKESDVVRMDIMPGSSTLVPAAGQYYYVYQPFTLKGWENHPFTLASYRDERSDCMSTGSSRDETGKTPGVTIRASPPSSTALTFLIRPYDGWTKNLRDACLKSATGIAHPRILLEGPYGHRNSLANFDEVLLIVGGTGIASAIPRVIQHIQDSKNSKTRTIKVNLIWSVRQYAFAEQISKTELSNALERRDFTASVYCSRSESARSLPETVKSAENLHPMFDVQSGRPNIPALISAAADEAKNANTSVAVLVCGPAAMADDCRLAVHKALKNGCRSMEYIEESFGW